jgi:pimeloyl-ACP methyl ester carboxylesterase
MPFLHLPDLDLYYETAGAGPRLVLLHGLGSSADDWALQLPEFAARYTVITVDLRGHGRSLPRAGARALTVAQMADDVAALLAELGGPPAYVVGLSLGGCTAQLLAARHPGTVRALVLCNTFARLRPAGLRGAAQLARRAWLFVTAPMPVVAEYVAAGLFPKPEHHALKTEAALRIGRNPKGPYLAAMRAVVAFDSRAVLAGIRCPTLVLAGDSDLTVPMAAGRALARAIPGASFAVIADSGHASPYDQTEAFNRAVLDFLAKV